MSLLLLFAVAARDGLAAAGDGRPTHRQNSGALHAGFSSSVNAAKMIIPIVGQRYQLLWDIIRYVFINAALIILRQWHCGVHTYWLDSSANHVADIAYPFGSNLCQERQKVHFKQTKYICA